MHLVGTDFQSFPGFDHVVKEGLLCKKCRHLSALSSLQPFNVCLCWGLHSSMAKVCHCCEGLHAQRAFVRSGATHAALLHLFHLFGYVSCFLLCCVYLCVLPSIVRVYEVGHRIFCVLVPVHSAALSVLHKYASFTMKRTCLSNLG